jgi:hypothetical protein
MLGRVMTISDNAGSKMIEDSPHISSIARSCELVGRFLYHFSKLEDCINNAIAKLLQLDSNSSEIVTANVEISRRLNIVQTAITSQNARPNEDWLRKEIDETFSTMRRLNDERNVIAHSSFEPHPTDGVQFKRAIAKGELKRADPHWSEEKFESLFSEMERLSNNLGKVLRHIKPYRPSLDFSDPRNSMYAAGIF